MTLIVIVVLILLTCLLVSLQKTYHHIPVKELRRRARSGDKYAAALYRVASYGLGLDLLLWSLISLVSAGLFVVLNINLAWWLALPVTGLVIWLAFVWIPARRTTKAGQRLARMAAPPLDRSLSLLQPLNSWLALRFKGLRNFHVHTGLYEKEDLVELLDKQSGQLDNRISAEELTIARGALTFADTKVREVMTPKRMIKYVDVDEPIGPLVMDELHATGFSRFPVISKDKEGHQEFVGTLYSKDMLGRKQGGKVADVMSARVYYINEDQNLLEALDAFITMKHHLFIVVNNFEEITGVLSIEDVLERIIGKRIVDEFDQYEDLRVVAMRQAKEDRKAHKTIHQEPTEMPEPELIEPTEPEK